MALLLWATAASGEAFRQGLWRGEDPRVTFHKGSYYHIENPTGPPGRRLIYRSKSLIDRGLPRDLPEGFPLFAPVFIDTLNGVRVGKWYAFDTAVWECTGDPYESAPGGWKKIKQIPFRHWSIDHFVFRADSGPHKGQWFMVWAGQEREDDPSTSNNERLEWWFESIYIARLTSLNPGEDTLANCNSDAANRIVTYRLHTSRPMKYPVPREAAGAWKDVVAEAPCVVQRQGTISLIYSGDGAQTSHYAMGIAFCKDGDVLKPASWVDNNQEIVAGPEFCWDFDRGVFGPGVARVIPSPDGREDWMYYHAKVWNTWNRADPAKEEEQQTKEMWTRYVCLKKIEWKAVTYQGQRYTIPELGRPDAPGTAIPLPSGDPGVGMPKEWRIEAERMIPFGDVMGDSIQQINGGTSVLKIESAGASGGAYMGWFEALAKDAPDGKSGALYRNTPSGSRLVVRAASPLEKPNVDLYVNGRFLRSLPLASTGSWVDFKNNEFDCAIPHGAEVRLVYECGKSTAANLDCIVIGRP